jgi:hypothetical protein
MTAILSVPVRLYRYVVIDSLLIAKHRDLRELLRRRGWRFVAAVIAYYLVRDTLLYVVVPLLVARGFPHCT